MTTRPRVLLADDHAGIVQVLDRLLSRDCDIVGVVADGRDVADAATRLQPVVTVVDLNMPNVNGLDICRQIRGSDPDARVIVISGMFDDDIRDEALAAGASGFFQKSAAGNELIGAIERAWTRIIGPPSVPLS